MQGLPVPLSVNHHSHPVPPLPCPTPIWRPRTCGILCQEGLHLGWEVVPLPQQQGDPEPRGPDNGARGHPGGPSVWLWAVGGEGVVSRAGTQAVTQLSSAASLASRGSRISPSLGFLSEKRE